MDKNKLKEILEKHKKWLNDEPGGEIADLRYADLSSADLRYADLRSANLRSANLSSANLRSADLRYADLRSADLRSANNLFYPLNCPEYGSFIGWKKALSDGTESIVKLQILEDSLRSSATGRKCRCSSAKVLEIQSLDGKEVFQCAESSYNPIFIYRTGEVVSVNNFDPDRWNECAAGIHFYITREEAVRHVL